jgi:alginate O-acetyltransferase complex protein AlgJ
MNHDKISTTQAKYNNLFSWVILTALIAVMCASLKLGYGKINEQFFQRDLLIQYYNQLRLTIGDRVFSPSVLVAENDWLEYTGDPNLNDYQNAIPLTEDTLNKLNKRFKQVDTYAQENNIEILVVIAPNKATIYPENLPIQIKKLGDKSRLDQITEFIPVYSNIRLLDLRESLNKAKQKQDIYYKTDTHWNSFGAYQAYLEIIKALSQDYIELQPVDMSVYQFTESYTTRDLANLIKAKQIKEVGLIPTIPTNAAKRINVTVSDGYMETVWTQNESMPTALIYHDSFGRVSLNEYLALNFSRSYFIHNKSSEYFTHDTIEYLHPNIIIIELAERNIAELENIFSKIISK